ncbi:uncharacterized protein PV09_02771 [Verruconis gallopava]|uniref:Rhodopsin domain-containing protein n=1 Tax=Verruconis gallopava TaxID=253628 RepID=A0A0D1XU67_9PEZI|nr:uncharacterized protein PV09_02771 [Verruconis gallopava]KIW06306.1 hypothetical protein PV09_02771 [Verruconis gallopava]
MLTDLSSIHRNILRTDVLPLEKTSDAGGLAERICVLVLLLTSWVSFLLRFYARAAIIRSLGWDDLALGVTLLIYTVYGCATYVVSKAISGHGYLLPSEIDKLTRKKWFRVAEVLYIASMLMLKISAGIFFLRIVVSRYQRQILYCTISVATAFNLAYMIFIIFQCGPPRSAATFLLLNFEKKCTSSSSLLGMSYTAAAISALTDLIMALLPIKLLCQSQMSTREKLVAGLLLALPTMYVVLNFWCEN